MTDPTVTQQTVTQQTVPNPAASVQARRGGRRGRPRSAWVTTSVGLTVALALGVVLSVALGTGSLGGSAPTSTGSAMSMGDVLLAVVGRGDEDARWVVMTLRMPRAIAGALVGAALGVSGAILQSVSRNVLASPDIVGFSAGAATGGLLQILIFDAGPFAVAVGAVLGGLVTAALVLLVSRRAGSSGTRLVLVGVGVGALLTAANSLMLTRAEAGQALSAAVWLAGSLNVRTWVYVLPAALALAVVIPLVALRARAMTLMELGDDTATALGVDVRRCRTQLVALSVVLVAVAVSVAGPIGFVALAAPQIGRRLARSPSVALVPAGLAGAVLLVGGDVLAMRVIAPQQLPVGIVTAALGGLYLVWLLSAQWRSGRG